jgi:hypothetical protein
MDSFHCVLRCFISCTLDPKQKVIVAFRGVFRETFRSAQYLLYFVVHCNVILLEEFDNSIAQWKNFLQEDTETSSTFVHSNV